MKKCLIFPILCLFAFAIFGNFNNLFSYGEETEELRKAWEASEKAIETANNKMIELETELAEYIVERDAIKATGVTTALQMWNPIDIIKGLFTSAKPFERLNTLYALIYKVYVQMETLNNELTTLDTARNTALADYNVRISQTISAIQTPRYYTIPECGLPCNNFCGVIFSTNDVGFSGLGTAAESNHKDTCGNRSATPPGCSVSYFTCIGKVNGTNEIERHKPRTCDKNIKYTYSSNGRVYSKRCGRGFRDCKNPRFLHNQYLSGSFLEFSTKHADNGDEEPAPEPEPVALHACDIHDTSVPGDHSSTWLCNESPCSNRQVPYCLAMCPYTGSHGTATTPMHVCEVHELWQSGDHSSQTSCSDTAHNSNGDSCQASGFYACVSHTPVYPAGGSTNPESVPELAEESDCPSCGGANFYDCVKFGERLDTCYSHIPNCSVESPSGDFWHSSQ